MRSLSYQRIVGDYCFAEILVMPYFVTLVPSVEIIEPSTLNVLRFVFLLGR
jgi:hypothetical protein